MSQPTDEVIAKLKERVQPEFWSDTLALLELAERQELPGHIDQRLHHDSRGRVNGVEHDPHWRRQGRGRKSP